VLALGMRLKITTTQSVVVATAILRNICMKQKEDIPPVSEEELVAVVAMQGIGGVDDARRSGLRNVEIDINTFTRHKLINEYFNSML
jgi:hypothetical protein